MTIYQQKKRILLPVLGTLAVSIIALVYFLLGKGSYIQVHDQMDGEILNYIYQAKYLFRGDVIPEFMNGMGKEAMTPPAPFGVLFYKLFEPFTAYVLMQWFVVVVGFLGMYCLCDYGKVTKEIAFLVAVLFAYMPFYPTYGLAALGQPMLVICFLQFIKGEKKLLPILGIVLYAGMSSMTLVGYVWVVSGMAISVWFLVKKDKKLAGRSFVATGSLLITYILTNIDLLKGLLGAGYVTHREEMVVSATVDLLARWKELFFEGGSYSNTYAYGIFMVMLFAVAFRRKAEVGEQRKRLDYVCYLFVVILVASVLAVLWNSGAILLIRKTLGGPFVHFQADRVYWTFPFLWMVLMAWIMDYYYHVYVEHKNALVRWLGMGICLVLFALQGAQIFRDGTMNKNLRLLLIDNYTQKQTWESVYMEDVFAQIDEVLPEDKASYSVVSLGMYPSIALYNGYTCADGYSNNYDLEYKHAFRRIIAEELEKREEVRIYFDDWGNRLYLPSAEYGYDVTLQKGKGYKYESLSYDTEAMKDMNIRYIFAAAPIANADELGMTPVKGSPYSGETSYYEIYVYEIM